MLVLERRILLFNVKRVYFCDYPCDLDGCDAVHILHCRNQVEGQGFNCERRLTAVTDLDQDVDTIWANMDKNCRRQIRKAVSEEIKVRMNERYGEFCQMNKELAQIKGFASNLGFSTPDAETLRRYGTLFTAARNGELLAGNAYLEDGEHILAWLSASKRLEVDRSLASLIGWANRLLHWEALRYAKDKGITEFDWGGLWPETEADQDKQNLNRFKLSFGGDVVTRYCYEKVYSGPFRAAQWLYRSVQSVGARS